MSQGKSEIQTKDNKLISQEDINKIKLLSGNDPGTLCLKLNFSSKPPESPYQAKGILVFPYKSIKKNKNIELSIELTNGVFAQCVFFKTYIRAGKYEWSYWENCDLSKGIFDDVVFHGNFKCSGANLEDASFINANLISSTTMHEYQLIFSKAKMKGVNFHNAHNLNCNFNEADLTKANFTLFQTGWGDTSYLNAILIDSIFDSAQFCLSFTNGFTGANLKGARLGRFKNSLTPFRCIGGDFTGANFEKAYISGEFRACKFNDANFDETFMVHMKGINCSQLMNTHFNKIYINKQTLKNMWIDKKELDRMYPNTPFFELSRDQNKLIIKPMDTYIFINKLKKAFPTTLEYPELKEHYIFSRGNSSQFFVPEQGIPEKPIVKSVILKIDIGNTPIEIELLPDTTKTTSIKEDTQFHFK